MAWLGAVSGLLGGAGSIMGGLDSKISGIKGQQAKIFEAQQLEQQAGQVKAASQREAADENRRAELIASRALALSAASGAGASDPTAVNLIADIGSEGAYRKAVALYQGEEQARQLNLSARMSRYEGEVIRAGGQAQQRASDWRAAGYLAEGGSSLYSRYGSRNPSGGTRIT